MLSRLRALLTTAFVAVGLIWMLARLGHGQPSPSPPEARPEGDPPPGERDSGSPQATRRDRLIALGLLGFGLLGIMIGGGAYLASWHTAWTYAHSPEAGLVERVLTPAEAPIWLDEPDPADRPSLASGLSLPGASGRNHATTVATLSGNPTGEPAPSAADGLPAPTPDSTGSARGGAASPSSPTTGGDRGGSSEPEPTPAPPRASAGELELLATEFRFFDPPEPGALAKLTLELHNRSALDSDPVGLAIPARWFEGYRIIGAIPAVLNDRTLDEGTRLFEYPGLAPGATVTLELVVASTDESLDPPDVRVLLGGGPEIARARPRTVAPRPRPGPARVVNLPRLNIQAAVVQTTWEPPAFVIGQIRGSANVSEGNTVLIGHFGGPAGDVFARLNSARVGDEVVALSRGLEYRFVISELTVLPNNDHGPMQPTETPRLTLMTCTGSWNPFTQDYSHRLWAVAEPPEFAEKTIAANARRAAEATAAALVPTPLPEAVVADIPAEPPPALPDSPDQALPPAAPLSAVPSAPPGGPLQPAEPTAAVLPILPEPPPDGEPQFPTPPRPRPTPDAAGPAALLDSNGTDWPLPLVGLQFRSPADHARVPPRFVVRGARATPIDSGLHAWLFVRADLPDSLWYIHPREIVARPDGAWEAELDIGGPPDLRHELRLGVVDEATHELLLRYVETYPNEPLPGLPAGFWDEATLVIVRTLPPPDPPNPTPRVVRPPSRR